MCHRQTAAQALKKGGNAITFGPAVAFTSTETAMGTVDSRGTLFVWDLQRNRWKFAHRFGKPASALLAINPTTFVVGLQDGTMHLWSDGKVPHTLRGHRAPVHSLELHTTGRFILSGSLDAAVIWNAHSMHRVKTLSLGGGVKLASVCFVPPGDTLLTFLEDGSIYGWDFGTFDQRYRLEGFNAGGFSLRCSALTQSGRYVAVAGTDSNSVYIWDLGGDQALYRILDVPQGTVAQLRFFDERIIVILASTGAILFVDIDNGKLQLTLPWSDPFRAMTVGPRSRHLASVIDNGGVLLWNLTELWRNRTMTKKTPKPTFFVIRPNNTAVSAGRAQPPPPLRVKVSEKQVKFERGGDEQSTPPATGHQPLKALKDQQQQRIEPLTLDEDSKIFNRQKLIGILRKYGEYPEKYRLLIWRFLLQIPENRNEYRHLTALGTHDAYKTLQSKYPIKSPKLLAHMETLLSALAHWSPIFGEVPYLPSLVFPFVKTYEQNALAAFEVVVTIITNWASNWFDYYPHPPVAVLNCVENLLSHHDTTLLRHFVKFEVTSKVYAWGMLQNFLSEILGKDDWLAVMDHVFTNHPGFLLIVVTAILRYFRRTLLGCRNREDFAFFFGRIQGSLSVPQLMQMAYRMAASTPADLDPRRNGLYPQFSPLSAGGAGGGQGQYPIFNKYPRFVVDYQVRAREAIRREEEENTKRMELITDLREESRRIEREQARWSRQQTILADAEDERRRQQRVEEDRIYEVQQGLDMAAREERVKQAQIMQESRNAFVAQQRRLQEQRVQRLDDELERLSKQRRELQSAALEDMELREIELKIKKAEFEQAISAEADTAQRLLDEKMAYHRKEQNMALQTQRAKHQAEDQKYKMETRLHEERMARMQTVRQQERHNMKVNHDLRMAALNEDLERLKVERQRNIQVLKERDLALTSQDVDTLQREADALNAQEEQSLRTLQQQHKEWRQQQSKERQRILDDERRRLDLEREQRADRLTQIESMQRERQFVEQLSAKALEDETDLEQEEEILREALKHMEEERRAAAAFEDALLRKEEELQRKLVEQQKMHEKTDSRLRERRRQYFEEAEILSRRVDSTTGGGSQQPSGPDDESLSEQEREKARVLFRMERDWAAQRQAEGLDSSTGGIGAPVSSSGPVHLGTSTSSAPAGPAAPTTGGTNAFLEDLRREVREARELHQMYTREMESIMTSSISGQATSSSS
eukprot:Clim_evm41s44 gene=Clim_evmTU41s44